MKRSAALIDRIKRSCSTFSSQQPSLGDGRVLRLLFTTLISLVAFQARAENAQSTTGSASSGGGVQEIRLLKAQLKRLEEKVNEQARKQKETHRQILNLPAKIAPVADPSGTAASGGVGIPPLEDNLPQDLAARMAAIRGVPIANPHSVYFNGITFTPGGFIALEGVFRDRFVGSDIATPFASIPFGNVRAGNANEFRLTSRQSRPSLLAKSDVNPTTHLTAFAEIDFLGAAQTANSNESNSFNPRLRQLYTSVDQDDFGAHLLVGQAWSFATPFLNGLNPRQENIPLTIEHQFIPGFVWTRQPQIRVVEDFGDNVSAGLSFENPQTTFASGPGTPAGPFVNGQPTAVAPAALPSSLVFDQLPPGGSLFNSANAVSLNHMPDIIGKVAWDPTIADRHVHMETLGMFRDFYRAGSACLNNVSGLISGIPTRFRAPRSAAAG